MNQVSEDGRIPLVLKITVRKYDATKKTSHRETKQANILPSLFHVTVNGKITLVENGQEKLLKIVMRLFERVVNLKLPFNITLLGLAFSKFQERSRMSRSIANFFIRTSDLEVQSITSLSSDGLQSIKNYQLRGSPTQMDFDTISEASHASYSSDISESEIEPSPKKNKFSLSLAKRRCLANNSTAETASPSKLRVAELRLNSKESDSDVNMQSLPHDSKTTIENAVPCLPLNRNAFNANSTQAQTSASQSATVSSANFPPVVDPDVFKELPFEVQEELLNQWRASHETTNESHANLLLKTLPSSKKSKRNTLHHYFITNN